LPLLLGLAFRLLALLFLLLSLALLRFSLLLRLLLLLALLFLIRARLVLRLGACWTLRRCRPWCRLWRRTRNLRSGMRELRTLWCARSRNAA
jgi:hypothetical protein